MSNNEGDNRDFTTCLSGNIRFLRKSRQWSQEELARHLNVKRSNIAAYESKNVEPRLSLLLKMAKLFNVDMAELIHTDISRAGAVEKPFKAPPATASEDTLQVSEDIDEEVLGEFVERSVSIRKMLEGFKVFYQFKRERQEMEGFGNGKPNIDIENFLNLIEHMLSLNEAVIKILDKTHREQKA
ncbi:MAG: helix-turn-helix domain-containing protein [Phaeodactylibacter sp.]|nr:helix-turn-helix domain-containing protein [Phaeodactylibacter sp.]MCB9292628.1 helix-turn-helix domain-containing protein [Lewinellaceae bacterium]